MSVSADELLTLQRGGSADRERLILKRAHAIEDAMSELHELDERARRTCEKIKEELGYDFVTVQLVDLGEQIIQTVQGSGILGAWYNIARHSLEGNPKFLDIQAHVALATPPVIEIIAGWDPRFDRFIYQKFGHENFVRAFVPLIVRRRHRSGALTEADPKQFRLERASGAPLGAIPVIPQFVQGRDFRAYEVIGTIEAGYDNSTRSTERARSLSHRDARMLFEAACRHGYTLYRATLRHVWK